VSEEIGGLIFAASTLRNRGRNRFRMQARSLLFVGNVLHGDALISAPYRRCARVQSPPLHKETPEMNFEGIYCFDTASVRFAFYPEGPGGPRVVAQISEETLHDEFGAREMGDGLLETCKRYFHVIEPVAIARYQAQAGQHGTITLTVDDFALHA